MTISPSLPFSNQRLVNAALAGLLCLVPAACVVSKQETPQAPDVTAGGGAAEVAHITSSENVGALAEADFQALCDERGGTVEVMPHCGGFATAKGFSYDNGTQLLSEHTCAGSNTCGGWNCVID